jgi:hypothetical protein
LCESIQARILLEFKNGGKCMPTLARSQYVK